MECKDCGKYFKKDRSIPHKKFCSKKCRGRYNTRKHRKNNYLQYMKKHREYVDKNREKINKNNRKYNVKKISNACLECKKEFSPSSKFNPNQKYCSKKCRNNYNKKKRYWQNPEKYREAARKYPKDFTTTCKYCGEEFKPSKYAKGSQFCCFSSECIRERQNENNRKQYRANPEKFRDKVRRHKYSRRALVASSGPSPSLHKGVFSRVRSLYDGCVYCGCSDCDLEIDHVVPIKGCLVTDFNSPLNLVLSCRDCNLSKSNLSLSYWLSTDYCSDKGISRDSIPNLVFSRLSELLSQQDLNSFINA